MSTNLANLANWIEIRTQLEGCASVSYVTRVSSLRNTAHTRCFGLSSAAGLALQEVAAVGVCLGLKLDEAESDASMGRV